MEQAEEILELKDKHDNRTEKYKLTLIERVTLNFDKYHYALFARKDIAEPNIKWINALLDSEGAEFESEQLKNIQKLIVDAIDKEEGSNMNYLHLKNFPWIKFSTLRFHMRRLEHYKIIRQGEW